MNDEERRHTYMASVVIELEDVTEEMATMFFDVLDGQELPIKIDGLGELVATVINVGVERLVEPN